MYFMKVYLKINIWKKKIFPCLLYQNLKIKNLKIKIFINYFKILLPYCQMLQTTCTSKPIQITNS